MALRGDEGRDKLRKAAGSCKQPLIRRFPNGATRTVEDSTSAREQTQGTETSKYLEEEKTNSDSLSSGERTGKSPNHDCYGNCGVVGLQYECKCEAEASGKLHHRG